MCPRPTPLPAERIWDRLDAYADLIRLRRPIGTFLLLWPTLWALWFSSNGQPDPKLVIIFLLGVFLMRSAGCAINDYADRAFDPHVERTRNRPLAAGRIRSEEAVAVFVGLSLIAFGLVLFTNPLTIALSFVAAGLAATYPFMKRYHYLPQLHLGIAFGWAVPMSYAAHLNHVPLEAWWLLLVTALWATAYDTMYAMSDRAEDLHIGVKSSAILFGRWDKTVVATLQLAVLALLAALGWHLGLEWPYFLGLAIATGLAVHQQYLIRDRDPKRCFQAFLQNNRFGAVIFVGLLGAYLIPQ